MYSRGLLCIVIGLLCKAHRVAMYSTSDIAVLFSFERKSFSTDKSLSASTVADIT